MIVASTFGDRSRRGCVRAILQIALERVNACPSVFIVVFVDARLARCMAVLR
jgi:hypothetical protein